MRRNIRSRSGTLACQLSGLFSHRETAYMIHDNQSVINHKRYSMKQNVTAPLGMKSHSEWTAFKLGFKRGQVSDSAYGKSLVTPMSVPWPRDVEVTTPTAQTTTPHTDVTMAESRELHIANINTSSTKQRRASAIFRIKLNHIKRADQGDVYSNYWRFPKHVYAKIFNKRKKKKHLWKQN